jgi:2',3'-cyclic-nucleotide 2'-phosphodiesterase (5'-nucleotidase family)
MRRLRAGWSLVLLLTWSCGYAAAEAAPAAVTLSVVSTNDLHGRLTQLPLLGGYVHNLRAARARDKGAVLLLDAGDIFQGTLESNASEGASMIRGMRALGYAAATLGNHEFDFGPVGPHPIPWSAAEDPLGALKARVAEAGFPVLCSNLQGQDGKPPPIPKLQASTMLRVAGVSVGIVGGLTKDTLTATHAANTGGLRLLPLAASIAQEAKNLRKAGARLVIALVHAGDECRKFDDPDDLSSCDPKGEAFELARALPQGSVDLIVAGHTHAGVAKRVNGIPIIEAFSNGLAFGRVDLSVPRAAGARVSAHIYPPQRLCEDSLDQPVCTHEVYENAPVQRDPAVLGAIHDDVERAKAERDKPLGVQVTDLVARASLVESAGNNLVADLILRGAPGADAAFSNAGAVRIALPVGPLTYGTVFEMFPFDNSFATLHIRAAELAAVIANNLADDHGILSIAGVRADAHCAGGALVVDLLDRSGRRIAPERVLTVATSDFLTSQSTGILGGLKLGPDNLSVQQDHLVRDAILDGLRNYPGGRIDGSDKRLYDPTQPRIRYPGKRPVRCSAGAAAR